MDSGLKASDGVRKMEFAERLTDALLVWGF